MSGIAIGIFGSRSRSKPRTAVAEAMRSITRSDAYADLPDATAEEVAAYAKATTGLEEDGAPQVAVRGAGPIRAVVNWVDTLDRKEAVETAKAFAETHFTATGLCSYHVERNPGVGNGWFYEVHEGGHGRAFLPNVVKALVATRKPVWFRIRNRAFTIQVTDGRPCCLLEQADMSKGWFARTASEVRPSRTRMQPIVWKGGQVLTAGVFTALTGLLFFGIATFVTTRSVSSLPTPPKFEASSAPSALWKRLDAVPLTRYVASIRYKDGRWQSPVIKPIEKYASIPDRPTFVKAAPEALPAPTRPKGAPGSAPGSGVPPTTMPGLNDILSPGHRPEALPPRTPGAGRPVPPRGGRGAPIPGMGASDDGGLGQIAGPNP